MLSIATSYRHIKPDRKAVVSSFALIIHSVISNGAQLQRKALYYAGYKAVIASTYMTPCIKAPNPAVDPVRFALWTLRDEAAQRRSPSR